jgi:outer membrane lipoprotein SlyB
MAKIKKKSRKKRIRPIYENGGFLQTDLNPYAPIGSTAGNLLENTNTPVGTIGGGVLKGAAAGAAFGPLGAGIGAGIGAISGVIKNRQNQELEEQQNRLKNQQLIQGDVQRFNNANGIYQQGGQLNTSLNQNANITE